MAKKAAPVQPDLPDLPAESKETPPASESTASPVTKVESITAEEINGSVTMPDVSERAIAAMSEAPSPAATDTTRGPVLGEKDAWNRSYDPAKYFPEKSSNGCWKIRGGGRKAGGKNAPSKKPRAASVVGESVGANGTHSEGVETGEDKYEKAAELFCRTGYGVLDMVFAGGGEWQPSDDSEHQAVKGPLAAYLRHVQSVDIPPGWMLVLAIGVYSAGRVTKPKTKARIAQVAGWVKGIGKPPIPEVPGAIVVPMTSQPSTANIAGT